MGLLTPSDRADLLAAGGRVQFNDDEILVMQGDIGDVVYVLTGGMVKISVSAETGAETMLAVRSRGDLIGEFAVDSQFLGRKAKGAGLATFQKAYSGMLMFTMLTHRTGARVAATDTIARAATSGS